MKQETELLTVAQAIVKFLDQQYLVVQTTQYKMFEGFFTIYGHGNVVGLGEALTNENHHLKVYQGKNEQGMGHVALGYTRQNLRRKHLVVTSSIGPGSANLITAAATATANHLPLLILPSDTYANRQPDPVLQQLEFSMQYNLTTNDAFKAVSRFWDRIERPEQLYTGLLGALRTLTDETNQGAVVLSIPQDVWGEKYFFKKNFFKKRIWDFNRNSCSEQKIKHAIDLIKLAQFPLLVIGGGVRYSEAQQEVAQLVKKYHIPYASTQAGKGAMVVDGKYNLGGIGVTGTLCANRAAQFADTIIGIGTKYSDFTTGSKSLFKNAKHFININVSQIDALKFEGLNLVGDAKLILQKLLSELEKTNYQTKYQGEIQTWLSEWIAIKDNFKTSEAILVNNFASAEIVANFKKVYPDALHQVKILELIQTTIKELQKDIIIVSAAGSLPGDLQRLWDVNQVGSYNVEYGYSCMGHEIQAAIGAKIAEPHKEVFAFVGDGSFLMLHSEILTALQEEIKINIILFDNSGFGCIDNLQTSKGIVSNATNFTSRTSSQNKLLTQQNFLKVSYAKIAAGYGCSTLKLTKYSDTKEIISQAIKNSITTLIEIKVIPKTMTDGFETWWRVGNAQTSKDKRVSTETEIDNQIIKEVREY